MSRTPTVLILAVLVGPLTFVGCASTSASPSSAPTTDASPDLERLEALYRARADSALLSVNDADVAFMSGMIHHHAQALVMSAMAPTHGASPTILTLTARITNAQKDEIALMQRWLADRGLPVPEVGPDGRMQGMDGMESMAGMDHSAHQMGADASAADAEAQMPGMLSPGQLEELDAARGEAFDRLFLTYMIQHHDGAVVMVHELFAIDGAAQDEFVFKLASDIQVDQTTEVARMQRMLDAMTPQPHD